MKPLLFLRDDLSQGASSSTALTLCRPEWKLEHGSLKGSQCEPTFSFKASFIQSHLHLLKGFNPLSCIEDLFLEVLVLRLWPESVSYEYYYLGDTSKCVSLCLPRRCYLRGENWSEERGGNTEMIQAEEEVRRASYVSAFSDDSTLSPFIGGNYKWRDLNMAGGIIVNA